MLKDTNNEKKEEEKHSLPSLLKSNKAGEKLQKASISFNDLGSIIIGSKIRQASSSNCVSSVELLFTSSLPRKATCCDIPPSWLLQISHQPSNCSILRDSTIVKL